MRAVRFHEYGGTDVLQVDDIDRPDPGSGEVVVEVEGAGVNPVDTYFRDGSYESFALPMIPGVDLAGTVAAVGDGVEEFSVGDRVYGTGVGRSHYGAYAEYVAAPTRFLARLPDGVDAVRAGGAGVVAVTAYRALVDHAGLEPAEVALIHGGSGGVGHVAVALADAMGARVITTAAPDYHDRLTELGADVVLDYNRDDLVSAVQEAGDGGVDVVLDHRLDDYVQFDADVANVGARVVGIGESDPDVAFTSPSTGRLKDVRYQLMSMFNTPDLQEQLGRVGSLMATDDISIEVARTYDLEEAGEAQRAVMEDSFLGKLVITP